MRHGVEVVPFGDYADPRTVVRVARAAEEAGWEGLFVWDHLAFVIGIPSTDPWVTLAAVAASTKRLVLGTAVTPLPRRRPQVLAQTLASLDILSGGRTVMGVGLGGVPEEYTAFGEPGDASTRAAMLDESLQVIEKLWSGELVNHHGRYYTVDGVRLSPLPVQKPRIPVWVGGESPPALRRASCWDGWVIGGVDAQGEVTMPPETLAARVAYIQSHRRARDPFEVAVTGCTIPGDLALPGEYAAAGATWWLESLHGMRGSVDELLARLYEGPPG